MKHTRYNKRKIELAKKIPDNMSGKGKEGPMNMGVRSKGEGSHMGYNPRESAPKLGHGAQHVPSKR